MELYDKHFRCMEVNPGYPLKIYFCKIDVNLLLEFLFGNKVCVLISPSSLHPSKSDAAR